MASKLKMWEKERLGKEALTFAHFNLMNDTRALTRYHSSDRMREFVREVAELMEQCNLAAFTMVEGKESNLMPNADKLFEGYTKETLVRLDKTAPFDVLIGGLKDLGLKIIWKKYNVTPGSPIYIFCINPQFCENITEVPIFGVVCKDETFQLNANLDDKDEVARRMFTVMFDLKDSKEVVLLTSVHAYVYWGELKEIYYSSLAWFSRFVLELVCKIRSDKKCHHLIAGDFNSFRDERGEGFMSELFSYGYQSVRFPESEKVGTIRVSPTDGMYPSLSVLKTRSSALDHTFYMSNAYEIRESLINPDSYFPYTKKNIMNYDQKPEEFSEDMNDYYKSVPYETFETDADGQKKVKIHLTDHMALRYVLIPGGRALEPEEKFTNLWTKEHRPKNPTRLTLAGLKQILDIIGLPVTSSSTKKRMTPQELFDLIKSTALWRS